MIKINNKLIKSSVISPGFENTVDGVDKFNKTFKTNQDIIINEVMNNNFSYLPQLL